MPIARLLSNSAFQEHFEYVEMDDRGEVCYNERMGKNGMLVIGVMSGTSADGVDVALARIHGGGAERLHGELLAHTTFPMDAAVRKELLRIAEGAAITAGEISQLNFRMGEIFGEAVIAACKKYKVPLRRVNLIGSHGQTIFHQGTALPFLGRATASTLQIGEGTVIAARTGIDTVSDFRTADMAVGGQGAPLVPYVDYLLYADTKLGRVSVNLGGIGNVTVLPANAKASQTYAFDTGPGNMVIDALVEHFTRGRKRFDEDGRIARQGGCNRKLLAEMMEDPYLKIRPPKSTGREYYGRTYVEKLLKMGKRLRASPDDLVRTATIFTALSVVGALKRFVAPRTRIDQVIVSGGGAHNPVIMGQLAAALEPIKVMPASVLGVDVDAKEAYAFAILAYESWHRRSGNLPSATGAKRAAMLGKISYAPGR
jgi:anhydro-N-acetylmuramic acid kinase